MIRFLAYLLGKSYEPCKGCEILKQQLIIANHEKEVMTNTLLDILKPQVRQAVPTEIPELVKVSAPFSRRRALLEAEERNQARLIKNSPLVAKPDSSINELENELGIAGEVNG